MELPMHTYQNHGTLLISWESNVDFTIIAKRDMDISKVLSFFLSPPEIEWIILQLEAA